MSYKSLLTVLTKSGTDDTALTPQGLASQTLAQAQDWAVAEEAHLDALCIGVDRSQAGYYYAGASAMVLQETIRQAGEEATALEKLARAQFEAGTPIRWGVQGEVAQEADVGRAVAARARFADLSIVARPYGPNRGLELESVVEGALFDGQCPVIVLPETATPPRKDPRVVIGWNESAEALNAVRAALPILRRAHQVHVCVIDPPQHGPNRSDPGGLLSQYLARHGVRVQVDVLSRSTPRVSDTLARHITDTDADLLVMGAYGHSRFREAILGGATRNMLEQAQVPVFMAH